ncbi:hypothetical protein EDB89DRAFT_2068285 [Lactarius sanguifluus]|nr:hypothetical protein EDB89DRAFT_2068285 [Lactarius sanguifluus]
MASVAPKYPCPCFQCNSRKHLTRRTIQGHLKQNQVQLLDQIGLRGSQHTINYLQSCYDQTAQLLAGLAVESQTASLSSHPDDNTSVAPASLHEGPEGAQRETDDFHAAGSAVGDADAVMTDVDALRKVPLAASEPSGVSAWLGGSSGPRLVASAVGIRNIPGYNSASDPMEPSVLASAIFGDSSDSGDMSGSEDDLSSSDGQSALFEVAEEILEAPPQSVDLGYDSDFSDMFAEDVAEIEDSALLSEALEESSQTSRASPSLPEAVVQLQKKLLEDYALPPPPSGPPGEYALSRAEVLSLQHYFAWTESQGTVKAYGSHAKVLSEATDVEILSLYAVQKLAEKLTGLTPSFIDMCPRSCIAYTGDFQSQTLCTHSHDGKICNEPRYKQKLGPRASQKPRAQMLYIPIIPIIQSHYSVAETSEEMRYRDRCLQETLKLLAVASGANRQTYSDFANSANHIDHYKNMGLFKDARDTAITISTDGAQLTMKKQSNVWLLVVVLLNLPPER